MAFAISLYGCGYGGSEDSGDSSPMATPIGTTVNLSQVKNFYEGKTQGDAVSFHMAGSTSDGDYITGVLSMSISAPTTTSTPIGTQTVNAVVQSLTLMNTGTGMFESGITILYYYQTGYLFKAIHDDGLISTPMSQTLLPTSAAVGDSGPNIVETFSDGSVTSTCKRS